MHRGSSFPARLQHLLLRLGSGCWRKQLMQPPARQQRQQLLPRLRLPMLAQQPCLGLLLLQALRMVVNGYLGPLAIAPVAY